MGVLMSRDKPPTPQGTLLSCRWWVTPEKEGGQREGWERRAPGGRDGGLCSRLPRASGCQPLSDTVPEAEACHPHLTCPSASALRCPC